MVSFGVEVSCPVSRARVGRLETVWGCVKTPAFLPVGTLGAPKAIHWLDVERAGVEIIMANTLHLYLRPGVDVVRRAGGLHAFVGWRKPIMVDSGGYQVFSLERVKWSEEGVRFPSPYDGSYHWLTPEKVVDIQRVLGADFCIALDVCPGYGEPEDVVSRALSLTKSWWLRAWSHWVCRVRQGGEGVRRQVLIPVLQGGMNRRWRQEHIEWLFSHRDSDQWWYVAIGGLSVGEPTSCMYEMVEATTEVLPRGVVRHLLGVGTPADIVQCVLLGVDTFDCVIPTRNGRRGLIYTWEGVIYIHNEKWKMDFSPIDERSRCPLARRYSKAFLRHLFKTGEILGMMIATQINLYFYMELMEVIRQKIREGTFAEWAREVLPRLSRRL